MKISIKELLSILSYGYFSYPVAVYIETKKENKYLKDLVNHYRLIWNNLYSKALEETNLALERLKEPPAPPRKKRYGAVSMKYLFLSSKLNLLVKLNKLDDASNVYNEIYGEFEKIPADVRSIVVTLMKANYTFIAKYGVKNINLSSRIYSQDSGDAFQNYSEASAHKLKAMENKDNKKIYEKELEKALEFYKKGLDISFSRPHPSGILLGLNQLSWFLRETDKVSSLKYADELAYYIGLYFEDLSYYYNGLDTIFEVEKINRDTKIHTTAFIMNYGYQFLQDEETNSSSKSAFKERIKEVRPYMLTLDQRIYKNTEYLRKYLAKMIEVSGVNDSGVSARSLRDIFNGKSEQVRAKTIRSLMKASGYLHDINAPMPVIKESVKLDIEISFNSNIPKIRKISRETFMLKFMAAYMSFIEPQNSVSLNIITEKMSALPPEIVGQILADDDDFFSMLCINCIFEPFHPFFDARAKLAESFLEELSKAGTFYTFLKFYLKCSTEQKDIVNEFARNYSRYRLIDWKIEKKHSDTYLFPEKTISYFSLNPFSASVAYFAFSDEKKDKFLDIINSIN